MQFLSRFKYSFYILSIIFLVHNSTATADKLSKVTKATIQNFYIHPKMSKLGCLRRDEDTLPVKLSSKLLVGTSWRFVSSTERSNSVKKLRTYCVELDAKLDLEAFNKKRPHNPKGSPTPTPTFTPTGNITVAPTNTPNKTATTAPTNTSTTTPTKTATITPTRSPTSTATPTSVPTDAITLHSAFATQSFMNSIFTNSKGLPGKSGDGIYSPNDLFIWGIVDSSGDPEQTKWYIEQQRRGAQNIQGYLMISSLPAYDSNATIHSFGIDRKNDGDLALAWGTSQQNRSVATTDTRYGGFYAVNPAISSTPQLTADAQHSTRLWSSELAIALELAREIKGSSTNPYLDTFIQRYQPSFLATAKWLTLTENNLTNYINTVLDRPYTHRAWMSAQVMLSAYRFSGNTSYLDRAKEFRSMAMNLQIMQHGAFSYEMPCGASPTIRTMPDGYGLNPEQAESELGGPDFTYQSKSLIEMSLYYILAQNIESQSVLTDLKERIRASALVVTSYLLTSDQSSVRTGVNVRWECETGPSGTQKTPEISNGIKGLILASYITKDPSFESAALNLARGQDYIP